MKLASSIAFLIVATWSINAFAQNEEKIKKHATNTTTAQAEVHYESNQLSKWDVEKIPSKDFEKAWMSVRKNLGYPKTCPPIDDNHSCIQWIDDSWLPADFAQWDSYDNKIKFYLAGWVAKYHADKSNRELTPEEFKSQTLVYYQCVNAVTQTQIFTRDDLKGIRNFTGTVEDNFKLCSMSN